VKEGECGRSTMYSCMKMELVENVIRRGRGDKRKMEEGVNLDIL
jgi:hypothetical protein